MLTVGPCNRPVTADDLLRRLIARKDFHPGDIIGLFDKQDSPLLKMQAFDPEQGEGAANANSMIVLVVDQSTDMASTLLMATSHISSGAEICCEVCSQAHKRRKTSSDRDKVRVSQGNNPRGISDASTVQKSCAWSGVSFQDQPSFIISS